MSAILELCRDIPLRSFAPGAVLLAEGEKSGLLYILVDGEVDVPCRISAGLSRGRQ